MKTSVNNAPLRGLILLGLSLLGTLLASAEPGVVFEGGSGPGTGKHIVLISGDEEYRSEEAMPMLGRLLSTHYGFKSTVLFAINKETGEIDPNTVDNIPGLEALETADLMVVFLRFRKLSDEQMAHVDAYLQTGKPVIGIRPSVVAFRNSAKSKYFKYGCGYKGEDFVQGFGRQVLGATWISHHGRHKVEGTHGIPVDALRDHPILRGVSSMYGETDVYTVTTPIPHGGEVLVMGQVLSGLKPTDPPADKEQMPLAWTKRFSTPNGEARVFMTTMGDARDFKDANFRRMVVNASLWAVGLEDEINADGEVSILGAYDPPPYGFDAFRIGLTPGDFSVPEEGGSGVPFKKGDHICYIGNTLADRMQHFGWLETLIQKRFPEKELVFRNLGFAADELTVRPRSRNFGSPDAHLTHSRADVIFAFFGYNESFAGEAGLPGFKEDLRKFIDATLRQKYNGMGAPRLVLFSPIAHEELGDPNLPDGTENNRRLALYTRAMAEVAGEKEIPFVDLFAPTRALYVLSESPLTVNGIHLNAEGNRLLAEQIDRALNGEASPCGESVLAGVREAVLDKNLRWFNRYRATDGYSTYGGRAGLSFVDGQTNKDVMDREMEILDAMTANRDRRIWAVARGHKITVDDREVPAPLTVLTNVGGGSKSSSAEKEGPLTYLGGEEAIEKMTVAPGMQVNLFASEEEFPELVNPVQMSVDPDGRMWVAAWHTYPHWDPNNELNDKLLIFPDDDGDGKADDCIVFADKLHNPTGFEFWNGGVLVACAPEILFLKDTDGDHKADVMIRYLDGIDSADTHCAANSFVFGPGGNIYFSEGIFHFTNVESPWGKPLRIKAPMLYRFNPRTFKIHPHFKVSPNPHGIVMDPWGYLFAADGTSGRGYYVGYPGAGTPHELYDKRVRPVAGLGRISGSHFPEENRGNLLICNTIGVRGVLQYEFGFNGADISAEEVDPVIVSSDGNFRPVDTEIGSDGALYILDWHNVIIGHMQHNLRDPNRDHSHGRIYRVTAKDRPLLKPVKMSGKSVPELLALLESPEDRVRYRVRIELSGRDSAEVLKAAKRWIAKFQARDETHARHLLEALWLHEQHNTVNRELLAVVLESPVALARAAATRTLGHWGAERVADGADLLQARAADPEALVRAEAVVAAASFGGMAAAEVIFIASGHPTDPQLDFNIAEARKTIDPLWKEAIAAGRDLSPAGLAFVAAMIKRGDQSAIPEPGDGDGPPDLGKIKADVVLKTVPGQMKYDLKEFTVSAGKKVKLLFDNPDHMPHNVVVCQIGAKQEVGALADAMATDPKAMEKQFVPESPLVLFATDLISDHSWAILEFVAPSKPGSYPVICTFPGHWRLMNCIMKVKAP